MTAARPSTMAVLTPPGRGGIAVVRCVGPAAARALEACFRPAAQTARLPETGTLAYGHIVDPEGRPLDEIILYRAGPATFEVNCHGGPAAVRAVSERLEGLGLEKADPDRLLEIEGASRIEREAHLMLRAARTPRAARILLDQLTGALAGATEEVNRHLDAGRQGKALEGLDRMLQAWRHCGHLLADPPRIAVAGPPNVGKSTLLNRLVGADRAITAKTPGTTRDYVEADAALDGVPVVLVDTAGLRQTEVEIERLGVERAREQAAGAEVTLYLLDATQGVQVEDEAMLAAPGERTLVVWNKADLAEGPLGEPGALAISALTGAGVDALTQVLLDRLGYRPGEPGEAVPFSDRQAKTIEAARDALAANQIEEALKALAKLRNTS